MTFHPHRKEEFMEVLSAIFESENSIPKAFQLCEKNNEYPCFLLIQSDILLADGNYEKAKELLTKGLTKHPNNHGIRFALASLLFKSGNEFKCSEIMGSWMDIDDIKPNQVLTNTEFSRLLTFYTVIYDIEEDFRELMKIYSWTLHEKHEVFSKSFAVELSQMHYFANLEGEDQQDIDFDEQSDFEPEQNIDYSYFDKLKLNEEPYNKVIQELRTHDDFLNLGEDVLQRLDKLTVDERLEHDILWIIREGLRGTTTMRQHIVTAIFLIGSKKMSNCVPAVLNIYRIGGNLADSIFNVDETFIFNNGIGGLLNDHWSMIEEILRSSIIYPESKCVFFEIIAQQLKNGNDSYSKDSVEALANYYHKNEYAKDLMWLCDAFIVIKYEPLKEFFQQDKFKRFYSFGIIDFSYFDSEESIQQFEREYDFSVKEIHDKLAIVVNHRIGIMEEMDKELEQYLKEKHKNEPQYIDEVDPYKLLELAMGTALEELDNSSLENDDYTNEPYRADKKIGRNEPCPCGIGKKYKKCCFNLN